MKAGDQVTIDEVSKKFNVAKTTLLSFEKDNLFDRSPEISVYEYSDKEIERLSLILSLKKIGLKKEKIGEYLKQNEIGRQQILTKQRQLILDDIHLQQKNLDVIDYLIYQLKNK